MQEESQSPELIPDNALRIESDISSHSNPQFHNLEEDRKWASYFQDDAEEKPKVNIQKRMKEIEDSEEKLRKEAYERGISAWKTAKIPDVKVHTQPESKPEIVLKSSQSIKKEVKERRRECLEESGNENESPKSKKRKGILEHEEKVKEWRERQPLQHFWKPDPLFYLHLRQLGYSKIEVEKALYHTDNKSVELAEKYIQEHPNLSPLRKEEVIADAEAYFSKIRPQIFEDEDSSGSEIKSENWRQRFEFEIPEESSQENNTEVPKGEENESSFHMEERIESITKLIGSEPEAKKVELLCVINSGTDLSAATAASECSKATIKIMEELQKDKWRKLGEDWTTYGKCVTAYQTDGTPHLHQLQEKLLLDGHLSYLAVTQNPLFPESTLPVVLCTLCNTDYFRKNYPSLSKVN